MKFPLLVLSLFLICLSPSVLLSSQASASSAPITTKCDGIIYCPTGYVVDVSKGLTAVYADFVVPTFNCAKTPDGGAVDVFALLQNSNTLPLCQFSCGTDYETGIIGGCNLGPYFTAYVAG